MNWWWVSQVSKALDITSCTPTSPPTPTCCCCGGRSSLYPPTAILPPPPPQDMALPYYLSMDTAHKTRRRGSRVPFMLGQLRQLRGELITFYREEITEQHTLAAIMDTQQTFRVLMCIAVHPHTLVMAALKEESSNKMFGGYQKVFSHDSKELGCQMKFGVFIPPQAESGPVPVIYWLSGLTCTEQNFVTKAGSQQYAAKHGFIVVAPDTSPRGLNIPGEEDSWDFGTGAGFYVDATEDKWKTNYRMFSYVTKELPALIADNFKVENDKAGIMGHSMGGHGALICALKNPGLYKSVSAFAPICNPISCPWGVKAFSGYLGEANKEAWKEWDACELAKKYNGPPLEIFVDQGKSDNFLTQGQLLPDNLVSGCAEGGVPIIMRMQEGYDHSYYFMATYMEDHFNHHAKYIKA